VFERDELLTLLRRGVGRAAGASGAGLERLIAVVLKTAVPLADRGLSPSFSRIL
jgi:hypothetical protein